MNKEIKNRCTTDWNYMHREIEWRADAICKTLQGENLGFSCAVLLRALKEQIGAKLEGMAIEDFIDYLADDLKHFGRRLEWERELPPVPAPPSGLPEPE